MDSHWCTIKDGKEYPNWAVKKAEDRTPWEQFMVKVYNETVRLSSFVKTNPEESRKLVEAYKPYYCDDNGEELYFSKYVSEDFVLDHINGKYRDLDDKENSPLPGLSLRQIIGCFYHQSISKLRSEMPPKIDY